MPVGADLARQGTDYSADGRAAKISGRRRRSYPPRILRTGRVPSHRTGQLPGNHCARFHDLTTLPWLGVPFREHLLTAPLSHTSTICPNRAETEYLGWILETCLGAT